MNKQRCTREMLWAEARAMHSGRLSGLRTFILQQIQRKGNDRVAFGDAEHHLRCDVLLLDKMMQEGWRG